MTKFEIVKELCEAKHGLITSSFCTKFSSQIHDSVLKCLQDLNDKIVLKINTQSDISKLKQLWFEF